MIWISFVSFRAKSNFVLLLCCWIGDHKREQVSQLASQIEASKEYHRQSCKILEELFGKLQKRWERQHSTHSAVHPLACSSKLHLQNYPAVKMIEGGNVLQILMEVVFLSQITFAFIFRISSASFHPRKEFKPKSIRGALNVFDNSLHNCPSRSASIKSSGPGNTSPSHIWISFIFSSIFHCLSV